MAAEKRSSDDDIAPEGKVAKRGFSIVQLFCPGPETRHVLSCEIDGFVAPDVLGEAVRADAIAAKVHDFQVEQLVAKAKEMCEWINGCAVVSLKIIVRGDHLERELICKLKKPKLFSPILGLVKKHLPAALSKTPTKCTIDLVDPYLDDDELEDQVCAPPFTHAFVTVADILFRTSQAWAELSWPDDDQWAEKEKELFDSSVIVVNYNPEDDDDEAHGIEPETPEMEAFAQKWFDELNV